MDRKKRVLLVINSPLVNAGVPNVIMRIVRKLSDYCVFDLLKYSNDEGFFDDEFQSYGGQIFSVSLVDYSKNRILFAARGLQLQKAVRMILENDDYDIIHCHNGEESGPCLKAAYEKGVKIRISHAHTQCRAWSNNPVRIFYFNQCLAWVKKYANVRLACSEIAGKSLFRNELFDNILNPIDYEYFHSIHKEEHEGINLMQIGYFASVKNQLFSIELLKVLKEKRLDVKLFFIGYQLEGEKSYFGQMEKKIQDYDLIGDIVFLPSDVDKKIYLGMMDYLLVPSKIEGLSLVAMEAQAAGVPCLLSYGVPKDVDFGLACFVDSDIQLWSEIICEKNSNFNLDAKLQTYDNNNYLSYIKEIYCLDN